VLVFQAAVEVEIAGAGERVGDETQAFLAGEQRAPAARFVAVHVFQKGAKVGTA